MIAIVKKHTFYASGLILGGIVLIASQWFEINSVIRLITAIVLLGAIGLSIVSAATSFTGISASFLTPLAASVPIILIGSLLYGAGISLNGVGISILIIVIVLIGISVPPTRPLFQKHLSAPHIRFSFPEITFFSCILVAFAMLFSSQTVNAVLGPWQTVRAPFFALYFISVLCMLWTWLIDRQRSYLLHLTLFGILSTSVALIAFPYGFGFDPLIHEAAQSHIASHGSLEPKTFYYIGTYVLTVFLSKITALDISFISRLIVPIGSVVSLIPLALSLWKRMPVALLFFAVPFPFLIVSTPWGFAYGITAVTVMSSMLIAKEKSMHQSIPFLLSVIALFLHPLAGIPAILYTSLFVLLPFLNRFKIRIRNLMLALYCFIGIGAIPAAFAVNALLSSQLAVTFSWPPISIPVLFTFQTRFSAILDPVYFYSHNLFAILIFIAVPGMYVLWKQGCEQQRLALAGMMIFGITLIHAFILTHIINFPSLISYERDDYGMRLVWLAFLFLIPALAETARILYSSLFANDRPRYLVLGGSIFIAFLLAASLYLSYPRNDAFQAFHGYNVSAADIEAVKWIYEDASNKRFIVLANQVLSAALIHEYGFGEGLFNYALPTSSPLYGIYQDILRKPSREQINNIKKQYSETRIYIAVNAYEPRFPLIIREMKKIIPRWDSFRNDAVVVFAVE